jgi:adenylate cyclase
MGWWIPSAPPALAWLGSAAIATAYVSRDERVQRALLMQLFSRHLDPKIASVIWERRDEFLKGGRLRPQRLTATVLFADVKDSTALGEKLDALSFMAWINDFMDAMAEQVHRHGGIVDDYFGDGLKADFGVPLPRGTDDEVRDDACAAVIAALAMQRRLTSLNREWTERGSPRGAMRVGICTGAVVAGSVGDRDRLKYTLVGDVVNTAARLESLDTGSHDFRESPCRILVAGSTAAHVAGRFELRPLGEHAVKGKDEPVPVFEVLGPGAGEGARPGAREGT